MLVCNKIKMSLSSVVLGFCGFWIAVFGGYFGDFFFCRGGELVHFVLLFVFLKSLLFSFLHICGFPFGITMVIW